MSTRDNSTETSKDTIPDVSLGSLQSSFVSPLKRPTLPNKPMSSSLTASSTTRLQTPSPPPQINVAVGRRHSEDHQTPMPKKNGAAFFDDEEVAVSDTPGPVARRKGGRASAPSGKSGVNLTLREQEKVIDSVKKENFSLKLKVHFLEERLSQLAPDHIEIALKQNINLKIEVQARGVELKKYKKLLLELQKELEKSQNANQDRDTAREAELRELRRRRGGVGHADAALQEANEQLATRTAELEDQLDAARRQLEENLDEIDRLRDDLDRRDDTGGERRARTRELETALDDLQARVHELEDALDARTEERDTLADDNERLCLEMEDLERRREAEVLERSQSRAEVLEERQGREAMEDEVNALRDRLAASQIELQQREEEVELKAREMDDFVSEHEQIVAEVEESWRGEVEEVRQQVDGLRDVLAERDNEAKELRIQIADFENNTVNLHDKFEAALAHMEREAEEKDAEIEAANMEIERLGERVWELEDAEEKLKDEYARKLEEEGIDRVRLESVVASLKEKLGASKSQLDEVTQLYEQCREDIVAHRSRQEELAQHAEDLVEEVRVERDGRTRSENELANLRRQRDDEIRRERRAADEKDSALDTALHDLSRALATIKQRDSDLEAVQDALRAIESEKRKQGEVATTDKFSLELELDRVRRDLERCEDELQRLRRELDDRDGRGRDREHAVDKLHAENRELASQLAAQTQARLNLSEKLDAAQAALRTAEAELAVIKDKASSAEGQLAKEQRRGLGNETTYREQLTERNTLLLTIYQSLDKTLGADKTKKGSDSKPFTNFAVFHENLVGRLNRLSQIHLDFDRRCKEVEARFADKLTDVKKQLDHRWKQIDRFETSVKNLAEVKHTWRRKYSAKEGELEAVKTTNAELTLQVSSLRRQSPADASELRSLAARATNAERRMANAQNQLLATEERFAALNERTATADGKWEARVKEYEARLKAAEERVKRERQGAKERIGELEANIRSLQKQMGIATKRNQQLSELVDAK